MGSDGKSRAAGKLGPAAILNQNPIFEMASKYLGILELSFLNFAGKVLLNHCQAISPLIQ